MWSVTPGDHSVVTVGLLGDPEGILEAALNPRQSPDQQLDEKQCIANALKEGRQAFLQRRITSEASIGKILFQNGYKLAKNLGLADAGDENIGVRRSEVLREFKDLSKRLERVAAIARRI